VRVGDVVIPPLEHYRTGLEKALQYDTDGRTFDDIAEQVSHGHAQYWPITYHSVIVTQVSGKTLHYWLAAGRIAELQAITPQILSFGRDMGCTKATLTGRQGWARSFLKDAGWHEVDRADGIIQMEVDL
jgi:hypothetical protein